LLGGMWEFPNGRVKREPAEGLADAIQEAYGFKVRAGPRLAIVDHAYSHFKITEHAFFSELIGSSQDDNFRWVDVTALDGYPMGKVDREIAKKLADHDGGFDFI